METVFLGYVTSALLLLACAAAVEVPCKSVTLTPANMTNSTVSFDQCDGASGSDAVVVTLASDADSRNLVTNFTLLIRNARSVRVAINDVELHSSTILVTNVTWDSCDSDVKILCSTSVVHMRNVTLLSSSLVLIAAVVDRVELHSLLGLEHVRLLQQTLVLVKESRAGANTSVAAVYAAKVTLVNSSLSIIECLLATRSARAVLFTDVHLLASNLSVVSSTLTTTVTGAFSPGYMEAVVLFADVSFASQSSLSVLDTNATTIFSRVSSNRESSVLYFLRVSWQESEMVARQNVFSATPANASLFAVALVTAVMNRSVLMVETLTYSNVDSVVAALLVWKIQDSEVRDSTFVFADINASHLAVSGAREAMSWSKVIVEQSSVVMSRVHATGSGLGLLRMASCLVAHSFLRLSLSGCNASVSLTGVGFLDVNMTNFHVVMENLSIRSGSNGIEFTGSVSQSRVDVVDSTIVVAFSSFLVGAANVSDSHVAIDGCLFVTRYAGVCIGRVTEPSFITNSSFIVHNCDLRSQSPVSSTSPQVAALAVFWAFVMESSRIS